MRIEEKIINIRKLKKLEKLGKHGKARKARKDAEKIRGSKSFELRGKEQSDESQQKSQKLENGASLRRAKNR